MKKAVFKAVSLLMVLGMVFTMTGIAYAADVVDITLYDVTIVDSGTCGADGDNVTWTLDSDGMLTISGSGDMKDYYASTTQQAPWYDEWVKIRKCVIESGVTSVGDYALRGCSNIKSVEIPDTVTRIGSYAFKSCQITEVEIPGSVESIGEYAFYGCDYLQSVTIPYGLTTIEAATFYDCKALKNVKIPTTVQAIGNKAFYKCSALSEVYYAGLKSEWDLIEIGTDNGCLTGASIYFNSYDEGKKEETDSGETDSFEDIPIDENTITFTSTPGREEYIDLGEWEIYSGGSYSGGEISGWYNKDAENFGGVELVIGSPSTSAYGLQLYTVGEIKLVPGDTYKITFDVSVNKACEFSFIKNKNGSEDLDMDGILSRGSNQLTATYTPTREDFSLLLSLDFIDAGTAIVINSLTFENLTNPETTTNIDEETSSQELEGESQEEENTGGGSIEETDAVEENTSLSDAAGNMSENIVPDETSTGKSVKVSAPQKAKIKKAKRSGKKLTIKTTKVSGANGYEAAAYKTKKNAKKNKKAIATSTSKNKKVVITSKKIKKAKKVFVRVRAYANGSSGTKVYGEWSKVKKVK